MGIDPVTFILRPHPKEKILSALPKASISSSSLASVDHLLKFLARKFNQKDQALFVISIRKGTTIQGNWWKEKHKGKKSKTEDAKRRGDEHQEAETKSKKKKVKIEEEMEGETDYDTFWILGDSTNIRDLKEMYYPEEERFIIYYCLRKTLHAMISHA
eukprot:TRINITY_DN1089_c0_g1_i1.p1 TRINITY_DN1089_c0_g1~~TRINITY_DN1089_c0_g1_i1.p1  ORF type:complete len:158 (-),score=45.78 TRINITY_DN1089_c0_g1_i1:284-757(-)